MSDFNFDKYSLEQIGAADKLLSLSLNTQDLPSDFLMMNTGHPYYHQYQKWLTKYELAIHCITGLEVYECEELAQTAIENYITDLYKDELTRSLDNDQ